MNKFTNRLPTGIMAICTLFFGALTYHFIVNGDGGADGLSMFFPIVIAGVACLGFLLLFMGTLLFTNKGDTQFKWILAAIVLLVIGFVAAKIFNPVVGEEFEPEITNEVQ